MYLNIFKLFIKYYSSGMYRMTHRQFITLDALALGSLGRAIFSPETVNISFTATGSDDRIEL